MNWEMEPALFDTRHPNGSIGTSSGNHDGVGIQLPIVQDSRKVVDMGDVVDFGIGRRLAQGRSSPLQRTNIRHKLCRAMAICDLERASLHRSYWDQRRVELPSIEYLSLAW